MQKARGDGLAQPEHAHGHGRDGRGFGPEDKGAETGWNRALRTEIGRLFRREPTFWPDDEEAVALGREGGSLAGLAVFPKKDHVIKAVDHCVELLWLCHVRQPKAAALLGRLAGDPPPASHALHAWAVRRAVTAAAGKDRGNTQFDAFLDYKIHFIPLE